MTVEARHQTFIRAASQIAAVPSAFDTPLGIRSVFTLAAAFISSCPAGSNLDIQAFPAVSISSDATVPITAGTSLTMAAPAGTAPMFCAFTNGGQPGGTAFTPLAAGACTVPQGLAGETYVSLTTAGPLTGVLSDDITVAGPTVVQIS